MDFSDFPDDTDEMLDLEAEMMREQARQFEEMNDYEYDEDQQPPTSAQGNSSSSAPTVSEQFLESFVSENTQKTKVGTNPSSSNKPRTAQSVLNQQSVDRKSSKKANTNEFARSIQEERKNALGKEFLAKNQPILLFEKSSKLYVMQETSLPPTISTNSATTIDSLTDDSSMPCIISSGDRIVLKHRSLQTISEIETKAASSSSTYQRRYMKQLLSRPIEDIVKEHEEMMIQKILDAPAATKESFRAQNDSLKFDDGNDDEDEEDNLFDTDEREHQIRQKRSENTAESNLWVNKYAPKTFTQLLSLEKTNRDVLKAVKRWDKFVFKKDLPASLLSSANKPNPKPNTHGKPEESNGKASDQPQSELDADNRPLKKVIILCGPPGTGKTTLAHVVANHCGYRPLELNASDDRSPDAIRDLLARATQNSTLHSDKRPNCIIIDEIDGLDASNKASLDLLLEILAAPLTSTSSKKDGKKSGSSKSFGLTRPLICICNDIYAPALRDLKRLADIYFFHLPQDLRLVQRLQHICSSEHVTPPPSTSLLHELITATGFDIRSSINSLQFAALHLQRQKQVQQSNQSSGVISAYVSRSSYNKFTSTSSSSSSMEGILESMMKVGLKDDHLDAYQIWQQIFHRNTSSSTSSSDTNCQSTMIASMESMVEYGDTNLLVQGMFENMHKVYAYDVHNINRHAYSTEWFSWSNLFSAAMISGSGNMDSSFTHYVSVVAGVTHYCHGVTSKNTKIEWPKKDRDFYYQQLQRQNLLQSMVMTPSTSTSLNIFQQTTKQRVVLDIICYLIDIVRPRLRSVPLISFNQEERKLFEEVIEIMESCDLHYQPMSATSLSSDNPDAAFSFLRGGNSFKQRQQGNNNNKSPFQNEDTVLVMEPNLDLLVTYHEYINTSSLSTASSSFQKNTMSSGSKKNKKLLNQHAIVSPELRHLIYVEQRKYSIRRKEEKLKELASLYPASTVLTAMEEETEKETEKEKEVIPQKATPSTPAVTSKTQAISPASPPIQYEAMKPVVSHGLASFLIKRPKEKESVNDSNKRAKTQDSSSAATTSTTSTSVTVKKEQRVHYKFNEGFSNAVKRTVYLKDFL